MKCVGDHIDKAADVVSAAWLLFI